jgi:hypothetical protein
LDQMIQKAIRFRSRIQGPKNIGPNDVKFGPFLGQKVVCKLDHNLFFFQENWIKFQKVPSVESITVVQKIGSADPNLTLFAPRIQGPKNIGPNDVKLGPLLGQEVMRKLEQNLFFFSRKVGQFSNSAQRGID